MYLHYLLKDCIFVLKDFGQSYKYQKIAKKSYITLRSPHRISVLFRLRRDFVIWKFAWLEK